MTNERYAESFYFIRENNERWYPLRVNGEFRVFAYDSNRLGDAPMPQPIYERDLQQRVFNEKRKVRCKPRNCKGPGSGLKINQDYPVMIVDDLLDGQANAAING